MGLPIIKKSKINKITKLITKLTKKINKFTQKLILKNNIT
jgi:hypothetical protein